MKKENYLGAMLGLAVLSLAACSNEENETEKNETMEARLTLTLQGTASTRATAEALPTQDSENTISRVAVAIFNGNGTVNIIKEFTTIAGITMNCTAGTGCTGIVVANAPAGHFAGVTTKSLFEAKTVALTQTSSNLPMSGAIKEAANTSFALTAGNTTTLTAQVSRLVARVAINSIKTDFDTEEQYMNATFTLKKIFLHNANTLSTVAVAPTGSDPKSGKDNGTNPELQDAVANVAITSTANTTLHRFYTFQHNDAEPTKLVIFGSFDPDGAGGTAASDLYYPVVVNKLQYGTTISSGNGNSTIHPNITYTIAATIKGKGVVDPSIDLNPAAINLTVTAANWTLDINQDVIFN